MVQKVHTFLKHRITNQTTKETAYLSCLFCQFYEVFQRINNFSGFAVAGVEVVVNEAGGLEEGVADYCAEEFEAPAFQVFADCVGDWR